MKRVLLECGGKSASILVDDVEITDALLERLLFEGCTLHAGQACILNSRLLVPDAIHDEVVDRLCALARAVVLGDPRDPDTTMGPLISREHLERVETFVAQAESEGATVRAGGRRPKDQFSGYFFEPTILTDVTPDAAIAQEEVFGPVLTVLRYRTDDEAVVIANDSPYGLGGGAVWGGPMSTVRSGWPGGACGPARCRSTALSPAMRRSADSSRVGSAVRAACWGCGLHGAKVIGVRRDRTAERRAGRRDRDRDRRALLHETSRRPGRRCHQGRTGCRRPYAPVGGPGRCLRVLERRQARPHRRPPHPRCRDHRTARPRCRRRPAGGEPRAGHP